MKKVTDPFDYVKGKIPRYYPVNNAVVFFDVTGFTRETTNEEMRKVIQKIEDELTRLLWDDYYWNEKNKRNDLILIPTGDGYAIGFHPIRFDLETVLGLASRIFKAITSNGDIRIRMGIAKGPNIRHLDLNEHNNLFGFGINMASRLMNLARENQILVHEDFANDILRSKKVEDLIDIGEFEIKHGQKVGVFNYFRKNDFGNENSPEK